MSTTPHPTKTDNADQVKDSLYGAMKDEVTFEANQIKGTGTAVDPNHSDVLVQKHVAGISMSFFFLILLVLAAVIGGIALYTHAHKASVTEHVGMMHPADQMRLHLRGRASYGDALVRPSDVWVR